MGKIFYILGKSSTGKDTIYKRICEDNTLSLNTIVLYTTRPIREGEEQGVTYNFVTEEEYEAIKKKGKIIEERSYNTMHGLWRYFTVSDKQLEMDNNSYIMIGVLSSFVSIRDYYGKENVIPIYIEVDDGIRLERALKREMKPENRKFTELCRRYLADSEDFSEDKIMAAGIEKRFENIDLEDCIKEVRDYIIQKK